MPVPDVVSALAIEPLTASLATAHSRRAGIGVDAGKRLAATRDGQSTRAADDARERVVGIGDRQDLGPEHHAAAARQALDGWGRGGRNIEYAIRDNPAGTGDSA